MAGFPAGQENSEHEPGPPPGPALGLYVHVPFCATTCDFCAFYQTVPKVDAVPRFLAGIAAEAELVRGGAGNDSEGTPTGGRDRRIPPGFSPDLTFAAGYGDPARQTESARAISAARPIDTAFWGGGTPGLLRASEMEQLGQTTRHFCGGPPAEWSVEMAPATVTADRLATLQALGVTRISLGVQSFRDELLDALGRQHTAKQAYRAYDLIRGTGFASVNLDLMFALPGQTETEWRADLDEAMRLAPDHLSTYCLTFEEDTALWVKLSQGKVKLDVDKEAVFYSRTWEYLAAAGFAQYEVSNFARPGHQCRHNLNTWRMQEWVGLGPSAASQHAGWRASNPPDLAQWHAGLAAGRRAQSDRTPLTPELLAADSLIFGLRMNAGVSLRDLRRHFPTAPWASFQVLLPRLVGEGLAELAAGEQLRLTHRGRLVADAVGAEILEAFPAPATLPSA